MYRYIYIHIHICTHLCACVCVRVYMHIHTDIHTYIYIYTRKHISQYTHAIRYTYLGVKGHHKFYVRRHSEHIMVVRHINTTTSRHISIAVAIRHTRGCLRHFF